MSLDPDPERMRAQGRLAVDLATDHLARLPEQRVARLYEPHELAAIVDEPLPRHPQPVEDGLRRYFGELVPHATFVNHPRFFAYVPGPGSWFGALAEFAAAATNLFTGTWLGGAAMARLEVVVLGWLRDALGLPSQFEGILTSGGSVANLIALAAARERCGDAARAVLYGSTETHHSLAKAARLLGFGKQHVHLLPVDRQHRLAADALHAAIAQDRARGLVPCCIVANAGTTNTGAIDPLAALADVAAQERLWLHVDGAYGAAAALLPEFRDRLGALGRADSITLDPHKWLYAPFESGCLLARDIDAVRAAFTGDADYMQDVPRDVVNFFERGPELTRGNRALKLWLLLRSAGFDAIAAAIRADLAHCRLACELLAADPRIQIVTEPELSVFTFRVRGGAEAGRRLWQAILRDGTLLLSSTQIQGGFALRWCVVSHRTTAADIELAVARVRGLLDQLDTQSPSANVE